MKTQSILSGLWEWSLERFPPVNFLAAGLTYLLPAWALRTNFENHWPLDIAGWVFVWLQLLILRVLDEHKDFKNDQIYYPERVLQRGITNLKVLRTVGFIAFAIQMVLLIYNSSPMLWSAYGFVTLWTFLMTKEFFIPAFLKNHIFLYSFSHLLISPLLIYWSAAWAFGAIQFNFVFFAAAVTSFAAGFANEVARKTKGVEEDAKGELTFSLAFPTPRAELMIFGFSTLMLIAELCIIYVLASQHLLWNIALAVALLGLLTASLKKYSKDPTTKARKANQGCVALIGLIAFVVPLVLAYSANSQ